MPKTEVEQLRRMNTNLSKTVETLSTLLENKTNIQPHQHPSLVHEAPSTATTNPNHGDTIDLTNDCNKETMDNSKINNKPQKEKIAKKKQIKPASIQIPP